jgi:tetratricopeptide (TPR) repeat protein
MAGAVQLVLQTDLSTSRSAIPVLANDESGAYQGGAKEALRATVTQRANRIYLETAITDTATQQDRQVINLAGAASSGVLPLLNELAKRVDNGAGPFSTGSDRALQTYMTAASASKAPPDRITALTNAIGIDPAFGLAYIALAEAEAQTAPQNLTALFQAATTHKAAFTPYDRARLDAFLAQLSHAPLAQQESAFRAVLQIAPNESNALVALGSLSFLNGQAADGTRYLQRALQLNPGNNNVRRALADGLFQTRRFAEAEKLLVGMDNNVAVLPELAVCVLLESDTARANAIAERLFASISNPDVKTLFHAVWLKLSGQSQKAVDLLTTAQFASPAAHAIAYSELAVWQMMANDFSGARQAADKARQVDPRPNSSGNLVAILATANGPADSWKQQVNSVFPPNNDQTKNLVLGYGLFLGGHYDDAAQVWKDILRQSGDTDLRARAMLAASLVHQGKTDQARQIKVQPFVPDFGDLYAGVSFLEMNRNLGIGVR